MPNKASFREWLYISGVALSTAWIVFWLYMTVEFYRMRGLADEPGRPASVVIVAMLCAIPLSMAGLGMLAFRFFAKK